MRCAVRPWIIAPGFPATRRLLGWTGYIGVPWWFMTLFSEPDSSSFSFSFFDSGFCFTLSLLITLLDAWTIPTKCQ